MPSNSFHHAFKNNLPKNTSRAVRFRYDPSPVRPDMVKLLNTLGFALFPPDGADIPSK